MSTLTTRSPEVQSLLSLIKDWKISKPPYYEEENGNISHVNDILSALNSSEPDFDNQQWK